VIQNSVTKPGDHFTIALAVKAEVLVHRPAPCSMEIPIMPAGRARTATAYSRLPMTGQMAKALTACKALWMRSVLQALPVSVKADGNIVHLSTAPSAAHHPGRYQDS